MKNFSCNGKREVALYRAAHAQIPFALIWWAIFGTSSNNSKTPAFARIVGLSMITAIDGAIIALFDGIPTSASHPL
jgi:hypothetical protein